MRSTSLLPNSQTQKMKYILPLCAVKLGGLMHKHKRPSKAILRRLFAALYTSGRPAFAVKNPRFVAQTKDIIYLSSS